MSWRVVWTNRALAGLMAAYLDLLQKGLDAEAIARATVQLDHEFVQNPEELGESRTDNIRVVFQLPLVVYFEVHAEERVVVATTVRWTTRP